MAGIGFELRKLLQRDTLAAPVAALGHAAVIAAGPWIFTILALVVISMLSGSQVSQETLSGFRVIVIYAFALSLVATAPIVIVATRITGDAIFMRKFERIRPLFVASLATGVAVTAFLTLLVYLGLFRMPLEYALVGLVCCTLVGMIWVSLAFCGAVRDYHGVTVSFLIGLLTAVLATAGAMRQGLGVPGMVLGFCVGLAAIFFGLTSRVLVTFPQPMPKLLDAVHTLIAGLRHYCALALGAFLASVAIWIDKWIMWVGPVAERSQVGLPHAPTYDSAMFIAYLASIPALALFVTTLETTFFDKYRKYYGSIANHATLAQIRRNAGELEHETLHTITRIVLIQATLCTIVALAAPLIVTASGLHLQQTGILRLGAIGAIFQFLFLACSSLLLFFARHLQYLGLQALFLLLQAGLTMATIALGIEVYGLGYLMACLICGVLSFFALASTMRDIDFLTFIVGNHRRPLAI
jgi:uncharacterized membrane protein